MEGVTRGRLGGKFLSEWQLPISPSNPNVEYGDIPTKNHLVTPSPTVFGGNHHQSVVAESPGEERVREMH